MRICYSQWQRSVLGTLSAFIVPSQNSSALLGDRRTRSVAETVGAMAIDLRLLSMAILRGPYPKTETIPLPSLYKDKPVVLYAIRRMG
jgi:hypothetical protein